MNQFPYLLREAVRAFQTSKLSSATAVFTIGICTAVLGVTLLVVTTAYDWIRRRHVDDTLRVYASSEAESPAALDSIRTALLQLEAVGELQFVGKEEALEEFRREFDSSLVSGLPYNPLPPSFVAHLRTPGLSAADRGRIRRAMLEIPGVESVSDVPAYWAWWDRLRLPLGLGVAAALAFLGGALFLIVSNAVKLNLYARRGLVENMKYCGAGEWFIAAPFFLEGLILGVVGSGLGVGITWMAHFALDFFFSLSQDVHCWRITWLLVAFTALLGSLASFRTVNRFVYEE